MERLLEYIQNHPLLTSLTILLVFAVLAWETMLRGQNRSAVLPQEAIRLMNQGAQIIDLRSKEDFAAGHVSGARHLDPGQQDGAADSLKKMRDKTVVLVCENGALAPKVTRALHANGFTKVFSLRGGLAAWRAEGLPLQRG